MGQGPQHHNYKQRSFDALCQGVELEGPIWVDTRGQVHISDVDGWEELKENARVSFIAYSDGDGVGAEQVESEVPSAKAYPSGAASACAKTLPETAAPYGSMNTTFSNIGFQLLASRGHAWLKALLPSDCCCPISLTSLEEGRTCNAVSVISVSYRWIHLGCRAHSHCSAVLRLLNCNQGKAAQTLESVLSKCSRFPKKAFGAKLQKTFFVPAQVCCVDFRLFLPLLDLWQCLDGMFLYFSRPSTQSQVNADRWTITSVPMAVADAFDLANAVKTTAQQAEGPAAVRMAALEREAEAYAAFEAPVGAH
ncbi:unnamed protein product [Symbiodinium natans]|uniref:Uncharacterized protein n=1 Tax=Symbiodinium natans TaxID=878477 RepID=A0A812TMQ1_9DINO|nr:unnamed protein product [Symbiodinium natans]